MAGFGLGAVRKQAPCKVLPADEGGTPPTRDGKGTVGTDFGRDCECTCSVLRRHTHALAAASFQPLAKPLSQGTC
jgi:hypothetical protein